MNNFKKSNILFNLISTVLKPAYFFLLIFLLSASGSFGQTDKEKAKILYKLPKYLSWDGSGEITIGLLGASNELTKELKKLSKKKYSYGKSFEVQTVLNPEDVAEFDNSILFVSEKYKKDYARILINLKGFQTIVVTNNWSDKKLLMINFSGNQKYQVNLRNIKDKGVSIDNSIESATGIVIIDAKTLLDESEQNLKNEKQKVKEQKEMLEMQMLKLKYQKKKLTRQKDAIEKQKEKIKLQKAEIAESEKKLIIKKKELVRLAEQGKIKEDELKIKTLEVAKQEKAIKEQNIKIEEKEKELKEKTTVLEEQNKEIEERQSRINEQKLELAKMGVTIEMQKNYLTISIIILAIILTLVFFVLRGYRIKKRQNKLLETQKEEIAIQASQLSLVNKELAQLSIVASETSNAVGILNKKGEFIWVNAGFTRMYGYTLQLLQHELGENIKKASTYPDIANKFDECIKDKKSVLYETIVNGRNGHEIWAQTSLTPTIDDKGEVAVIVLIDTDITIVKEAQAEIANKNKKITDSIIYAEKIQRAILTPDEILGDFVKEHFILFKPRDIVSGDFYWASQTGNKLIVAAADCTGHGVPGAFLSMLGISFLNQIIAVHEEKDITADLILNELRDRVKTSLKQTGKEGEAKDGMDIALCIIDKENSNIEFSGAQNPLILIRNEEITIYKGDDQPIGIYHFEKPFTSTKIDIQKDDSFYIFSDGYADQFGEKTRKKFYIKRLRQFFLKIHKHPFKKQRQMLDDTFETWKGNKRQMDDVLIIGIKVK